MWVSKDISIRDLSKKLVDEFFQMEPAPHDRELRRTRMDLLKRLAQEGKLREFHWSSALCEETDTEYRINGKHTSTLLHSNPEFINKKLKVVLTTFICPSLKDVAELYSTYDNTLSTRTLGDLNRLYAASDEELSAIPARLLDACVSGIAANLKDSKKLPYKTLTHEKPELMYPHKSFILMVAELLNTHHCTFLIRTPIVAGMHRTWMRNRALCREFWSFVASGEGTNPRMGDRRLREWIKEEYARNGRKTDFREVFAKSVTGFRSWREGKTTNLNYRPDKPIPKA